MARWRLLAAIATALLVGLPASGGDILRPLNTENQETGVLVDGLRGGLPLNDKVYTNLELGGFFNTLFPIILLDNLANALASNEIMAFSARQPPLLIEEVAWTSGDDTIELPFEDQYRIDLFVWIVRQGGTDRALDGAVTTAMIWQEERLGLAFDNFVINEVWDDPDAPTFHAFNCGLAEQIKLQIGHNPDVLNVYYVDTVDFGSGPSTGNGVFCGGSVIGMGRHTTGHLLTHELGHSLGLAHVNVAETAPFFDQTNVMHNASGTRRYLTEGQTFRAVHQAFSALNWIYDIRPGEAVRSCAHAVDEADLVCPQVQKRIWADGAAWPPN